MAIGEGENPIIWWQRLIRAKQPQTLGEFKTVIVGQLGLNRKNVE